ncbi:MAG: DNA alkylation repair protein [Planctomycetota bacterium]
MDPKPHSKIEHLKQRKAALRQREIPADVLDALSKGWIESKNLVEWLSVDRLKLLKALSSQLNIELSPALKKVTKEGSSLSSLQLSKLIAQDLATLILPGDPRFKAVESHTSDVVREWGALIVGHWDSMPFAKRLAWVKPFADDPNPGTREIAWMALRHHVASSPVETMSKLLPWTGSRNERLRRYATEITRPCGVWCPHIELLKSQPQLGLELLEPLKSDESLYVRNSVANWLNDASKSKPEWVLELTKRWQEQSETPQTLYIIKRALRTLNKKHR